MDAPDIFISYAREDEAWASGLAAELMQCGRSVFWDRRIPAGRTWRSHIGKALKDARCVVVVWTVHAVESDWVLEEADQGKRRGVLVPVFKESVVPPMGFGQIQAADLTQWQRGAPSKEFAAFLEDLSAVLGPALPTEPSQVSSTSRPPAPIERMRRVQRSPGAAQSPAAIEAHPPPLTNVHSVLPPEAVYETVRQETDPQTLLSLQRKGNAGWRAGLALLVAGATGVGVYAFTGRSHQALLPCVVNAITPRPTRPQAQDRTVTTLRLVQVVPRLPTIHLYAVAQDVFGRPNSLERAETKCALVGLNRLKASNGLENEPIAIVFLVDVSASVNQSKFDIARGSVQAWLNGLQPDDQAAIVTVGANIKIVQDFTGDLQKLTDALKNLTPSDQQSLLYQGVVQAIDMSRRLDMNLPLRRAIVVLTDGLDDQQRGASRLEVIDKLAIDPVPIYGIGVAARTNVAVNTALKDFSAIVRGSGGQYRIVESNEADILQAYSGLRDVVSKTRSLTAECDGCEADGSAVAVRLTVETSDSTMDSQTVTVRMVGSKGQFSQ